MAEPVVWLNGALARAEGARIDPADRGFTLGDGLFETMRAAGGVPRHFGLHMARLRVGAGWLGIEVPMADAAMLAACVATLDANGLGDGVLRLTLTRGMGGRGLAVDASAAPTLLITAAGFVAAPATVRVVVCRETRRNDFSPLAGMKTLNYGDNILARREAVDRGAEDAILLNTRGDIAEATTANLFVLGGGGWLTPRLRDGALPGIFRGLALARGVAREARITPAELAAARGVCLGNVLGLRVVSSVDGRSIGSEPGAVGALRMVLA